mmetsp:Transcript_9341/g.21982  ORF Transcript_9341/g.21982 Transcript_9341/m.21982 type:complete len:290 (-) Transcript_9341:395-1264(-)
MPKVFAEQLGRIVVGLQVAQALMQGHCVALCVALVAALRGHLAEALACLLRLLLAELGGLAIIQRLLVSLLALLLGGVQRCCVVLVAVLGDLLFTHLLAAVAEGFGVLESRVSLALGIACRGLRIASAPTVSHAHVVRCRCWALLLVEANAGLALLEASRPYAGPQEVDLQQPLVLALDLDLVLRALRAALLVRLRLHLGLCLRHPHRRKQRAVALVAGCPRCCAVELRGVDHLQMLSLFQALRFEGGKVGDALCVARRPASLLDAPTIGAALPALALVGSNNPATCLL